MSLDGHGAPRVRFARKQREDGEPAMSNGRFVWRDLNSLDPEKSKAFFAGLLGWEYSDMSMGDMFFNIISANGVQVGGVSKLDPAHGAPSNFTSYLSVDDVDATA